MSKAGLPYGVIYEGTESFQQASDHPIDLKTGYRTYAGGSNAQSALIQAIDIVLSINHHPTASGLSRDSPSKKNDFILEMRQYMPGPHRRFLESLASVSNVRSVISALPECRSGDAKEAYTMCVSCLRCFRNIHIKIVTRYILVQSSKSCRSNPGRETGTGGTQLIPFLKQMRDKTTEALIEEM